MDHLNLAYEIIVVDDGSTDTTKQVASTYNARVLSDGKNHGKGYSVRKAFQQAQGDIIVTIDADGEHKPEEIPKLINPLNNGTDVVAGSRFLGNGKGFTTRLNVIGNKFLNFTITILTGKYITDSQTGFRAFKKAFIEQVNLESNGFEIEAEITVKSLRNGFKLEEVPVSCERREQGKSKIRIGFDSAKIFRTILKSSFTPIAHGSYSHETHETQGLFPPTLRIKLLGTL
jgi:glycosyltransferase involved in cell wall biosynthesis